MSPLSFDAEVRDLCVRWEAQLTFLQAIHQIVSFFGPVDEINTYALGSSPESRWSFVFSDFSSDMTVHPLHTAPRSPGMDASVWEVNFNHRDDALNALMVSLSYRFHLASPVLNSIRLYGRSLISQSPGRTKTTHKSNEGLTSTH